MIDIGRDEKIDTLMRHVADRESVILKQANAIKDLETQKRRYRSELLYLKDKLRQMMSVLVFERQLNRNAYQADIGREPIDELINTLSKTHPDIVADVKRFHVGIQANDPTVPTVPSDDERNLRWSLIDEEVNKELHPAMMSGNLTGIADGIADAIYVLVGTALKYGIPLYKIWDEVQSSNMSKFGADGKAIFRDDGKVLKGPSFRKPDIQSILDGEVAQ